MADGQPEVNAFNPEYRPQAQQATPNDLVSQWRNFLSDPASRAALINFGAQLAQPVAVGQNWKGHLSQAVGAGGEAANRAMAEQRKDAELESKDADREARNVARERQAETAEHRARIAEAGLAHTATRAQAALMNAESAREIREQRAMSEENRRRYLDAQVLFLNEKIRNLSQKTEDAPALAEAKRQLDLALAEKHRAGAGLLDMRTQDIPLQAGVRQQRADAYTRRLGDQTILDTQREEGRRERAGTQAAGAAEKRYLDHVAVIEKNNAFLPLSQRKAIPTREEFQKMLQPTPSLRNSVNPPATTPTTPTPTPTPPATRGASARPPGGGRTPSQEAINDLLANPQRASEFDAWYGPGSAARVRATGM